MYYENQQLKLPQEQVKNKGEPKNPGAARLKFYLVLMKKRLLIKKESTINTPCPMILENQGKGCLIFLYLPISMIWYGIPIPF